MSADNFYYVSGVPRNKLGLDHAEKLAEVERDMSTFRMEQIRTGQVPEATSGKFDLDHLKAIHQHTFQDTYEWAGVTRSETMTIEGREYHAAPTFMKEGSRYPFTVSHQVNPALNTAFEDLQQKNHLQGLSREEFAKEVAQTYSAINQAHPFMEGNGRTQREFISQLADQAGHPMSFEVVSGERMNQVSEQARLGDREGLERLFNEITDPQRVEVLNHAQTTLEARGFNWRDSYIASATPGEHYEGVKALHDPETLVIKEQRDFILVAQTGDVAPQERHPSFTASPYPSVETQVAPLPLLQDLDRPEFAQQAAQRLMEAVKGQDMTQDQVRAAADALGEQAQRPLNLSVITEARLQQDTDSARQGNASGFERMFSETSDSASVKLMRTAINNLEQRDHDTSKLYVTVAKAGEQHQGELEFKTTRVGVVVNGEGQHLATPSSSLKGMTEGPVEFTAKEPTKAQQQLDYE